MMMGTLPSLVWTVCSVMISVFTPAKGEIFNSGGYREYDLTVSKQQQKSLWMAIGTEALSLPSC